MSLRSLKSRAKKLCEENNIEFIDFARSTHLHKKWSIVFDKKGKRVNISFGDNRYDDFTQHKDKQRRKNYLNRAKGIRNGSGKLTWNDPTTANFWSVHLLW